MRAVNRRPGGATMPRDAAISILLIAYFFRAFFTPTCTM